MTKKGDIVRIDYAGVSGKNLYVILERCETVYSATTMLRVKKISAIKHDVENWTMIPERMCKPVSTSQRILYELSV